MVDTSMELLTPRTLLDVSAPEAFLRIANACCPAFIPEHYNHIEPIRKVFDPEHPDDFLDTWKESIFWKRRKPRVEAFAGMANPFPASHGWLSLDYEARQIPADQVVDSLGRLEEEFGADFAFIHTLASEEYELTRETGSGTSAGRRDGRIIPRVTTHKLRKWLPNLYWLTIFGPPYVRLFGRENLLSAPAPTVRELPSGSIMVRLSESPLDFLTNYAELDALRTAVKQHLNRDAFFRLENGKIVREVIYNELTESDKDAFDHGILGHPHKYNVPAFDLDIVHERHAEALQLLHRRNGGVAQ